MASNKRGDEVKSLFQELRDNPYRRLFFAFFLISIIPILVLMQMFFGNILKDSDLLPDRIRIFILAAVLIILGYVSGYTVVQSIINKALAYAARAKRADELKSKFAISLAHDLKSPLGTIKANVSGLKAGYLGPLSEKQGKAVDICNDVADRMNSMVAELISTYMFEAREAKISIEQFDLRSVIESERRELDAVASAKKISVILNIAKTPLFIKADKEKMVRAINNILNNSIKYTPQGGFISVNAYPAEGFARVEFVNTSAVIPQDKLDRIFDKFERLDTSQEGHGLGLAIAKDIVELSKGRIWASSSPGKPTTFIMLLPLAGEEPAGAGTARKTILLVEDDEGFINTLKPFLVSRGYEVMVAKDASGGIRLAAKGTASLVVLDLGLPDRDGFFVLENLRKSPGTTALPVIISTANVGVDVERKAWDLGANEFIRKPYDAAKLLAKIEAFL